MRCLHSQPCCQKVLIYTHSNDTSSEEGKWSWVTEYGRTEMSRWNLNYVEMRSSLFAPKGWMKNCFNTQRFKWNNGVTRKGDGEDFPNADNKQIGNSVAPYFLSNTLFIFFVLLLFSPQRLIMSHCLLTFKKRTKKANVGRKKGSSSIQFFFHTALSTHPFSMTLW